MFPLAVMWPPLPSNDITTELFWYTSTIPSSAESYNLTRVSPPWTPSFKVISSKLVILLAVIPLLALICPLDISKSLLPPAVKFIRLGVNSILVSSSPAWEILSAIVTLLAETPPVDIIFPLELILPLEVIWPPLPSNDILTILFW